MMLLHFKYLDVICQNFFAVSNR